MDRIKLLRELSDSFGAGGFEEETREIIRKYIEGMVDQFYTDRVGNLIALKRGEGKAKIMLDAHSDEVGLIVSHIEKGFIKFTTIGGWDVRILPGHAVTIKTRDGRKVRGVIGTIPPHVLPQEERNKPIPLDKLYIDVGATSQEELKAKGINVGDPAVLHYPLEQIDEDTLMGKAFDDRAGCAVAISVLEKLKNEKLPFDLYVSFSMGEELGLRGTRTAAWQIEPDFAIALEGTIAADTPGIPPEKQPTKLGKGPAITVADKSIVVKQEVLRFFENVAEKHNIPYQYKIPTFGGTDAGVIHLTKSGCKAGVISTPTRYIHSPLSIMKLSDFNNTVELVYHILKELDSSGLY